MSVQNESSSNQPYRILVMDDEDYIRNILKKMFEKFGYLVELTSEGQEAVEKYKQLITDGTPADLVLLDLTIPGGMGGMDTAEQILEFNPQAKIVISSGNPNDPMLADYQSHGIKHVLSKPFRLDGLMATTKEIIEAP